MNQFDRAKEFGEANGFKNVYFFRIYNGKNVFVAEAKDDIEIVGYPCFIITDNSNIKIANQNETMDILDLTSPKGTNEVVL